uniref:Myb/SANT-like DNA-binding domain-containing protein n=1 Tax=Magallana gigas TaxID=29159 RepID=A0A8W8JBG5_MAGGI|nr:myb/SANT-like DNA-binding domain-containing protein 4 [Crassostrea gigas]
MAKRCPNFSAAEISVLTDEVESKKDILFSKQNSTVSNALKRDAWKEVALKVNAINTTGYVRTGEEMKKKWICLSSESRKKLALNRREQRKTGGGCLPSEATLRPIDEKIEGIIGETSISGVEGGIDVLDSSTTTDALLAPPSNMTDASIECQPSVENSRLSRKGTKRTVSTSESQQRDDLMTRLVTAEEERLSIEKRRLEIEKRRLDTEEKRLKIEDRRLAVAEQQLQIQREQHSLHLCQLGIVNNATLNVPLTENE